MNKKISLMILMTVIIGALTGCSKKTVDIEFSPFQTKLSFGDLTEERVESLRKEEGMEEVKIKENKSLLLKIEENKYKELMEDLTLELETIFEYMESSDDFSFIDKIETDEKYSDIQIVVDEGKLEKYKSNPENKFAEEPVESSVLSLGSVLSTYKGFANTGEIIKFTIIDKDSKEVIDYMEFPKDYKEMLEIN